MGRSDFDRWLNEAPPSDFISGQRAARRVCEAESLPYPSTTGDSVADVVQAAFWTGVDQGRRMAQMDGTESENLPEANMQVESTGRPFVSGKYPLNRGQRCGFCKNYVRENKGGLRGYGWCEAYQKSTHANSVERKCPVFVDLQGGQGECDG